MYPELQLSTGVSAFLANSSRDLREMKSQPEPKRVSDWEFARVLDVAMPPFVAPPPKAAPPKSAPPAKGSPGKKK